MDKVRFISDRDFAEIAKWLKGHGMGTPDRALYPETGFIYDGVAAGFLYLTNSSLSILDCYVTNPLAPKAERDKALDAITEHLLTFAGMLGTRVVKCDTKLKAISKRALKHKFQDLGTFQAFSKELI